MQPFLIRNKLARRYLSRAIAVMLLVIYLVPLSACSMKPSPSNQAMPAHHTDNGFRNLYIEPKQVSFFTFLRMRYFGDEEWADYQATADRVERVETPIDKIMAPGEAPQVTWIGHATTLVQYQGINVLTDPMFSERASPFSFMGPKRATPPSIGIEQLPPIDFVLISHNHYDHLDADTVKSLGDRTTWLVPLGYKQWFADQGVSKVVEFDWWDSHKIAGATVTATPSQHWSGRNLNDRNAALWASWSVQIKGFKFWFAGDTGYNAKQFKQIGERCGPFDLALIPVGGYAPRWFMHDMHVNPEEAVQVHKDIRSKYSVGIHWGAFPLTSEAIDEPPVRLREVAKALTDSAFVIFPLGKTGVVPNNSPNTDKRGALQAEKITIDTTR